MRLNPWELLGRNTMLETDIFTAHKDSMRSEEDGRQFDFYVLQIPDWVNVIAVTEHSKLLLVRQYRHAIEDVTLEIPGGMVDAGENPLDAARRELKEETGYEAGAWKEIGSVLPNPAIQTNRTYTFVATRAVRTGPQEPDENERIEVIEASASDIVELLSDGQIEHALVFAAFMHLVLGSEHRKELLEGLKRFI